MVDFRTIQLQLRAMYELAVPFESLPSQVMNLLTQTSFCHVTVSTRLTDDFANDSRVSLNNGIGNLVRPQLKSMDVCITKAEQTTTPPPGYLFYDVRDWILHYVRNGKSAKLWKVQHFWL